MSQKSDKPEDRFWLSRKFWMAVISAAVFTALAVTETVTFTSGEVMTFVLGLAGISIGGHIVSDVASMYAPESSDAVPVDEVAELVGEAVSAALDAKEESTDEEG